MFNTGYKNLVLNSTDGVSNDGTFLIIDGYGKIPLSDYSAAVITNPADPVAEASDWLVTSGTEDYFIVRIVLTSLNNDERHTITFDSVDNTVTGIINGYVQRYLVAYPDDDMITITAGLDMTITVNAGYEKYIVAAVQLQAQNRENIGSTAGAYTLTGSVSTAGSIGVLQGWQVEESVRMNTFCNTYPYSQYSGGNSKITYTDEAYVSYDIKVDPADLEPIEQHEFIKHSYVNAAVSLQESKHVLYILEDVNADFDTIVTTLPPGPVTLTADTATTPGAAIFTFSATGATSYTDGTGATITSPVTVTPSLEEILAGYTATLTVNAHNASGTSSTATESALVVNVAAVTGESATAGSLKVTVAWIDAAGADEYAISWSGDGTVASPATVAQGVQTYDIVLANGESVDNIIITSLVTDSNATNINTNLTGPYIATA